MAKHFFDPVARVQAKLDRANQHIEQLQVELVTFLGKAADGPIVHDDPKMREALKDFYENSVVDLRLSVLTGEAINQLRSCLDHMVCALVLDEGGTITKQTQFPIFDYKPVAPGHIGRYQGQIKGITRPEVLTLIESYQPYKRGDRFRSHWLHILRELNNSDKHASLLLHVVQVEPRMRVESLIDNTGEEFTSVGPDDGTEPTNYVDASGDFVEIVKVERSVAVFVTFDQWGDTEQAVSIEDGLTTFASQTAGLVAQLASCF